ncbi:hypothetical protein NDU88_001215, partial [Pleurodeles waltl]
YLHQPLWDESPWDQAGSDHHPGPEVQWWRAVRNRAVRVPLSREGGPYPGSASPTLREADV